MCLSLSLRQYAWILELDFPHLSCHLHQSYKHISSPQNTLLWYLYSSPDSHNLFSAIVHVIMKFKEYTSLTKEIHSFKLWQRCPFGNFLLCQYITSNIENIWLNCASSCVWSQRERKNATVKQHMLYVYFQRSCINLIFESLIWCLCMSGRGTESR